MVAVVFKMDYDLHNEGEMRMLGWELWQALVTWDVQGAACPTPGMMHLPQRRLL